MAGRRESATMAVAFVFFLCAATASGDFSKDEKECEESLVGLSACLSYVTGTGEKPTEDCCKGLRDVMKTSPKCLCILIKDRDNPQLGFKIDANRSVSLPSSCNVHSNISDCPALLHLDPNSKDAKIFTQLGGSNSTIQPGVPSSNTLPAGGSSDGGSSDGSKPATGAAAAIGARLMAVTLFLVTSFAAILLI